ncbi:hypothetical protein [Cohnella sp. JJ-181]|uniref:hypothetical protein n=1 Tax=Cohnella rhizoplanae TaxID=2974897 RepID=UPI0022FFA0B3|nr:hypothetical protein [Cohnella sp. JJ-181]CAI6081383.1 hypothetical protein COHCIP112018_03291 [Cohnella sp. JJ-181]
MTAAQSTFVSRCSLVVLPVDPWTGRAISGAGVAVRLEGLPYRPVRTTEGGYAFTDLAGGELVIVVEAPLRLTYRRSVDLSTLPMQAPVVLVPMLPGSRLDPPPGATGLRLRISDSAGKPLPGVGVFAWLEEESCSRGRLADDYPAGADGLRFAPENGRLLPGDPFVIMDRGGKAIERCRAGPDTGLPGTLALEAPTDRDWRRGAILLPASSSRSDSDGVATLPLRGAYPARFRVKAELSLGGKRSAAEWTAAGGTLTWQEQVEWPAG